MTNTERGKWGGTASNDNICTSCEDTKQSNIISNSKYDAS